MAARHGTHKRYSTGCRCEDCTEAQRIYQRRYRERVANGETRPAPVSAVLPPNTNVSPDQLGPVEAAVELELAGIAGTQSRPALVAVAAAMARLLDGRVPTPKPAAAKVLVGVMDALHKGSARGRRGSLALVRTMTERGT
jgi:hypothetical protein